MRFPTLFLKSRLVQVRYVLIFVYFRRFIFYIALMFAEIHSPSSQLCQKVLFLTELSFISRCSLKCWSRCCNYLLQFVCEQCVALLTDIRGAHTICVCSRLLFYASCSFTYYESYWCWRSLALGELCLLGHKIITNPLWDILATGVAVY